MHDANTRCTCTGSPIIVPNLNVKCFDFWGSCSLFRYASGENASDENVSHYYPKF